MLQLSGDYRLLWIIQPCQLGIAISSPRVPCIGLQILPQFWRHHWTTNTQLDTNEYMFKGIGATEPFWRPRLTFFGIHLQVPPEVFQSGKVWVPKSSNWPHTCHNVFVFLLAHLAEQCQCFVILTVVWVHSRSEPLHLTKLYT